MAVLLPPSTSHRQITAIHSAVTSGKRNKMRTQTAPPASTNGLRRPHLGLHVLSLVAPMNGWINNPVMGPAMLRMGRYSGFAPNRRKRGFTAVWVRPKLNWTPKNPRFIHAMLPGVINGRRASSSSLVFSWTTAVSTAMRPLPRHTQGAIVVAAAAAPTLDAACRSASLCPADEHLNRRLRNPAIAEAASRATWSLTGCARLVEDGMFERVPYRTDGELAGGR